MTTNPTLLSRSIVCFYLACAIVVPCARAVEVKNPKLVSLELTVNGVYKEIPRGEVLNLVRGDLVVLEKAKTLPEVKGNKVINLLGFRSPWKKEKADDDSFQKIDTTLLKKGWSKDGLTEKYQILVRNRGKLIGDVSVILKNPKLISVEVQVNGATQIVKDKGLLKIKSSDEIKLGPILSTDKHINDRLSVAMEESKREQAFYDQELKVFHGSFEIGSVNIQVER